MFKAKSKQEIEINPRLVAIAGPLRGKVFTLDESEYSIGREISNHLCLGDPSISRQHCVIQRENEGRENEGRENEGRESDRFVVHDLESLNGVFVNGVPVKQRPLTHGDCLKVGDSIFLFLLDEDFRPVEPLRINLPALALGFGEAQEIYRATVPASAKDR